MDTSQRFLITGGAGFLGINLVRFLLDHGAHRIRVLDFADFDYPERPRIETIRGDIRDLDTVREAVYGVDVVIHTAAALPLYSKQDIFSTEVEGTRNLLECALGEGIDRFVHISSTAVYGIPHHHPIYEGDPLVGVGDYGRAKIQAERVCAEYRKKGLCIAILRPKSFIGPERLGVFALLYDWAKDAKNFPLIGNGRNRYQLLDVEDLCEAIGLCIRGDPESVSDVFNIGAGDFKTMKEDYQAVLDEAGFGRRILCFPAWPAIMALKALEALHLSPLYKWIYETAHRDSFVSIEKARRVLGYRPRYSNKDALIRNYRWYTENLDRFSGKSGVSHRVPWAQGILKILKAVF
jgi:nucleoside-diphosphate-sugar epimerase